MVAAALACGAAPADASWPLYGRDLANTRTAPREGPPLYAVAGLKEAWRFSAPADFTGTPVVADGLVVAGSFDGNVYALDAVTGKLRWKRNLGQPINASAAIDTHAPGGPAVYVPVQQVGRPRVTALSLTDGKLRWSAVLTNQSQSSVYASPVVWRRSVYVGTSGPNGDNSTARGTVVSLDAATGAVRWRTYTVPAGYDGGAVWSSAAVDPASGRVYEGTGNAYHGSAAGTTDSVLALDSRTGQIVAHYQADAGDSFAPDNPAGPDADFGASPNLLESPSGRPLVGEGAKDGTYYALDRSTLTQIWKTNIGPGSGIGGLMGSTAFDGTRVYGSDGLTSQVAAIDRRGSVAWSSGDGGSADFAPLTVAHGVLYTVNQAGLLTARQPATGTVLNRLNLGGPSFGGISATGGALYVAVGIGPPPAPAPQQAGSGAIVAFGDTSRSAEGGLPGERGRRGRGKRIRLTVRPRRATQGRRTVFRFRARVGRKPVSRALIRFARHRIRTGKRGRAKITLRLGPGWHRARATKRHLRSGTTRIFVRRHSRRRMPRR